MRTSDLDVLDAAAAEAAQFLTRLATMPVQAPAGLATLRARMGGSLPESPAAPDEVIRRLVADVEGGLMGSSGPRFFGWVIGGALPVAIAADWLTTAWDQNAGIYTSSPAAAVAEEVAGGWLKELLGLPAGASFGFVTGAQMANTVAIAAARHSLLRRRGIDVEKAGLSGAPAVRVLLNENAHESLIRAVKFLGLGTDSIVRVRSEQSGAIALEDLRRQLARHADAPTVLCLVAGDLCQGAFDPFHQACDMAHAAGAWVHIDGAFGLWAAAHPDYRHLLAGHDKADSWVTDGHKWLNVPFDCGYVFVADSEAHRAVFSQRLTYAVSSEEARDEMNWNPEWSRRARGFPTYAALRSLGRAGIVEMIGRACESARQLVGGLGELPGVEVLSRPVINQGLVRFLDPAGSDHDARTDQVIARIQADGATWFGGTTWRGMRCMRVSVCNWRTTSADVEQTILAVSRVLRGMQ